MAGLCAVAAGVMAAQVVGWAWGHGGGAAALVISWAVRMARHVLGGAGVITTRSAGGASAGGGWHGGRGWGWCRKVGRGKRGSRAGWVVMLPCRKQPVQVQILQFRDAAVKGGEGSDAAAVGVILWDVGERGAAN